MKPEPIEEFPPVPTQLLWMFDGIDRKEATKMMHDYADLAIKWKPSKALLRAWGDVQTATDNARRLEDENERLNLELQKRDKCSFIGAMRDCPTHGESEELKQLRAEVSAWRERLGDDYEYRPDVPYVVMKTPNAKSTAPVLHNQ